MDSLTVLESFLKTFCEQIFYIALIVFCFLRNKIYNHYVLLARFNHSKGFKRSISEEYFSVTGNVSASQKFL